MPLFENRRYSALMLIALSLIGFVAIMVWIAIKDSNHKDPAVMLAAIGFTGLAFNQVIAMARAEQSRRSLRTEVCEVSRKLDNVQTVAKANQDQLTSEDLDSPVSRQMLRQLIAEVVREHNQQTSEIVQRAIREYHDTYHATKPKEIQP
jgi:hypothetical protein